MSQRPVLVEVKWLRPGGTSLCQLDHGTEAVLIENVAENEEHSDSDPLGNAASDENLGCPSTRVHAWINNREANLNHS